MPDHYLVGRLLIEVLCFQTTTYQYGIIRGVGRMRASLRRRVIN